MSRGNDSKTMLGLYPKRMGDDRLMMCNKLIKPFSELGPLRLLDEVSCRNSVMGQSSSPGDVIDELVLGCHRPNEQIEFAKHGEKGLTKLF